MTEQTLSKLKKKFVFGLSVSYEFVLKRKVIHKSSGPYAKAWCEEKLKNNRIGYIVGWKWLSNGNLLSDEDGGYYIAQKSIFALEIKHAMINKADYVLPSSIRINDIYPKLELPSREYHLSQEQRNELSHKLKMLKGKLKR